jgi:hypothetical protein
MKTATPADALYAWLEDRPGEAAVRFCPDFVIGGVKK